MLTGFPHFYMDLRRVILVQHLSENKNFFTQVLYLYEKERKASEIYAGFIYFVFTNSYLLFYEENIKLFRDCM